MRALLSQPQFAPLRLADEVALALALRDGVLDGLAPDRIASVRDALPAWLDQHAGSAVRMLEADGTIDTEQRETLSAALRALAQRYHGSGAVTERLAQTTQRIENLQQLEAVVTAMRGISASRTQQAHGLLLGLRAYAAVIGGAIGQALALVAGGGAAGDRDAPPNRRHSVLRGTGLRRCVQ